MSSFLPLLHPISNPQCKMPSNIADTGGGGGGGEWLQVTSFMTAPFIGSSLITDNGTALNDGYIGYVWTDIISLFQIIDQMLLPKGCLS